MKIHRFDIGDTVYVFQCYNFTYYTGEVVEIDIIRKKAKNAEDLIVEYTILYDKNGIPESEKDLFASLEELKQELKTRINDIKEEKEAE